MTNPYTPRELQKLGIVQIDSDDLNPLVVQVDGVVDSERPLAVSVDDSVALDVNVLSTVPWITPTAPIEVATTDRELSVRTDAGTGLTVITDSTAPLAVRPVDGSTVAATTISVTSTAALIGSSTRVLGELFNSGSTTVYVGGSTVTSTNGYPILPNMRMALPRAPIYIVTASGETGTVKLLEVTA